MPTLAASAPVPTVDDVDRIAAVPDPIVRNLQITQCYHELARAMIARTGINANWCTFATWASKQAGQTIRKQDFARLFEAHSSSVDADTTIVATVQALGSRRAPQEIIEAAQQAFNPRAALDQASDAVARGNKKVFEEIGREFARFLATCFNHSSHDDASITAFCEQLRPGSAPHGQALLQRAFKHYYAALFVSDAKARAELMLLANLEIGLHEQTRLQPEISEALNAAFVGAPAPTFRLVMGLFPIRGVWMWSRMIVLRLLGRRSLFDQVVEAWARETRRQVRLMITELMMTLELSNRVRLRLGDDVPGDFPPILAYIDLPDLRALLADVDPTPDSAMGSGARDWANLRDRMHFIADMFRRYHDTSDLFDPPFTSAQIAAMKSGRVPDGRL